MRYKALKNILISTLIVTFTQSSFALPACNRFFHVDPLVYHAQIEAIPMQVLLNLMNNRFYFGEAPPEDMQIDVDVIDALNTRQFGAPTREQWLQQKKSSGHHH